MRERTRQWIFRNAWNLYGVQQYLKMGMVHLAFATIKIRIVAMNATRRKPVQMHEYDAAHSLARKFMQERGYEI